MISAAMSASMNSIAWNVHDRLPELPRSFANASDEVEGPRRRAHRARADHQPLLDEPVLRELVPLADLAEHLRHRRRARRRTRRSGARTRTCACTSGCARAARRACPCPPGTRWPSPGRRRRARGPRRSRRRRRDVTCHFSPSSTQSSPSRRAMVVTIDGVGAGAFLGDRVRVAALAADRRTQVALLLLLGAALQRDRRTPRDVPQRARRVAPPLLDQHLLEEVEPLAAVVDGVVDRVEAPVEHRPLRGSVALGCRGRRLPRTRPRAGSAPAR